MWSQAVTSSAATDDDLQPMCLDELLSREANCQISPDYRCDLDPTDGGDAESWEVPVAGDFLGREMPQAAHNDEDIYAVPMVPLEIIERGAAPPLSEFTRVCRAILGLAKVDGNPPFQLQ